MDVVVNPGDRVAKKPSPMPESRTQPSADQPTPSASFETTTPGAPSTAEASQADRRASVWDVLHGLEVRDFLETLPSEMWEQLFPGQKKQD